MAGAPEPVIEPGNSIRSVALMGHDYNGLKPKMLVEAGDQVTLGQPLFVDKRDPEVLFTAPGSGTISAINRGARRALQSVVIELDETEKVNNKYTQFTGTEPDSLSAEDIRSALWTSGLWTAFRTRPFNKVPQSDSTPEALFVTAIDRQ